MSVGADDGNVPVIVTERLVLRAHRLDDLQACTALWADPAVVRFIGGVPFSREQSWARLLRYAGSWQMLGFGFWAIEEKESGAFVGEAGFLEAMRDMTPSIAGTLETGWVLNPAFHGKGYATEAVSAMMAWGRERFPEQRMTCIIASEHGASLRVAEKLGFERVTTTSYLGSEVTLLECARRL